MQSANLISNYKCLTFVNHAVIIFGKNSVQKLLLTVTCKRVVQLELNYHHIFSVPRMFYAAQWNLGTGRITLMLASVVCCYTVFFSVTFEEPTLQYFNRLRV